MSGLRSPLQSRADFLSQDRLRRTRAQISKLPVRIAAQIDQVDEYHWGYLDEALKPKGTADFSIWTHDSKKNQWSDTDLNVKVEETEDAAYHYKGAWCRILRTHYFHDQNESISEWRYQVVATPSTKVFGQLTADIAQGATGAVAIYCVSDAGTWAATGDTIDLVTNASEALAKSGDRIELSFIYHDQAEGVWMFLAVEPSEDGEGTTGLIIDGILDDHLIPYNTEQATVWDYVPVGEDSTLVWSATANKVTLDNSITGGFWYKDEKISAYKLKNGSYRITAPTGRRVWGMILTDDGNAFISQNPNDFAVLTIFYHSPLGGWSATGTDINVFYFGTDPGTSEDAGVWHFGEWITAEFDLQRDEWGILAPRGNVCIVRTISNMLTHEGGPTNIGGIKRGFVQFWDINVNDWAQSSSTPLNSLFNPTSETIDPETICSAQWESLSLSWHVAPLEC